MDDNCKNITLVGEHCTGCGVCSYICPKQCIRMLSNDEGFLYPVVSNECNNCGLCSRRCPQLHPTSKKSLNQSSYIGITKDNTIYKKAASGGIFGTLAKAFLNQVNAFVCGAAFIDGKVKHIIVSKVEEIALLQNSKYVQSDLGQVFPIIKELLEHDSNVLFCGTPCQVDGLYAFLGSRPERLVTLDLICHGVPSPLFLKKDLQKYIGSNIKEVDNLTFRWKQPFYRKTTGAYFLNFKKYGKDSIVSSSNDPYFACFLRNESFRLSCYTCKYANLERCGDITIGDCDSASYYPSFYPSMSRSTIILNNSHGVEFWEQNATLFNIMPLDLKREAERNHQLSHPSEKPACRDWIYKDVTNCNMNELENKYCRKNTLMHRVLFFCQKYLPNGIVSKIISVVR